MTGNFARLQASMQSRTAPIMHSVILWAYEAIQMCKICNMKFSYCHKLFRILTRAIICVLNSSTALASPSFVPNWWKKRPNSLPAHTQDAAELIFVGFSISLDNVEDFHWQDIAAMMFMMLGPQVTSYWKIVGILLVNTRWGNLKSEWFVYGNYLSNRDDIDPYFLRSVGAGAKLARSCLGLIT